MFTVYVLYSPDFNKIYIGYTSNLTSRLQSHNHLAKKGYTVKYRPWELLMYEHYQSKSEAIKREKQLKSATGRQYIWEMVHQKHKTF